MKIMLGKKSFITATICLMAFSSLAFAQNFDSKQSSETKVLPIDRQIDIHQAIKIAKTKVAGDVVSVDFDDDYQGEYEVTLINGLKKYEVTINAFNGKVIQLEKESVDDEDKSEVKVLRKAKNQLNQAISKVQNVTGGQIVDVDFDLKNGLGIYEMKVIKQGQKYKIDIDANTGEVLKNRLAS